VHSEVRIVIRLATVGLIALALSLGGSSVSAQAPMTRFPVASAADSTFTFRVDGAEWVRTGMIGTVVDGRQQDALVAQIRILGVQSGTARALITGQTTRVTTAHTVLLETPVSPWWRERMLWMGAAAGALVGFLVGAAVQG
jgi:hypothetical protein